MSTHHLVLLHLHQQLQLAHLLLQRVLLLQCSAVQDTPCDMHTHTCVVCVVRSSAVMQHARRRDQLPAHAHDRTPHTLLPWLCRRTSSLARAWLATLRSC
jgi:hypothetical protein